MDDLIGRDPLRIKLWELLAGSSLILSGPRRVGKSSILKDMQARPRVPGQLFRVDLQGLSTVEGLVERVREALPAVWSERAVSAARQVQGLGGVVELRAAGVADPWSSLLSLLRGVSGKVTESGFLVVALDEVPWWLDALEDHEAGAARTALAQLRHLREHSGLPGIRWIFTGSVGLGARSIHWGAEAEINDIDVVNVPPLDEIDGITLFETHCPPVKVTQEAAQRAHRLAGGRPHWIKLLAARVTGAPVSALSLEAAEDRLLSREMRHLFQEEGQGHFVRTWPVEQAPIAVRILSELAHAAKPLPRMGILTVGMSSAQPAASRSLVDKVIQRLLDEYYLVEVPLDSLDLAVPLFGRWWNRWGAEP